MNIPTEGGVESALTKIPGTFINIRSEPGVDTNGIPIGEDLGNLYIGNTCVVYPPVNGWVYVNAGTQYIQVNGYVSLQDGAVVFTPMHGSGGVPATVVASNLWMHSQPSLAVNTRLRYFDEQEAVTLYPDTLQRIPANDPQHPGARYPFMFLENSNHQPGWAAIAAIDGTAWIQVDNGQIIDVSEAQGSIDWSQVKAAGITTAILRATQGVMQIDKRFHENVRNASAVGIRLGFYHALIASVSGASQAVNFLSVLPKDYAPTDFPIAIDVELENHQTPGQVSETLYACAVALEKAIGQKPMIYTRISFWDSKVGAQHDDYFSQCPLWIAAWTDAGTPRLPRSFSSWRLWQFSSEGEIAGISGNVDLSRSST